jgi:prepilin-type N-terminal cleavage/methylation domain-containing protein
MNATRAERREKKADSRHARRGFSLVELMVVIGIMVILISILGVVLANMGQQAKEAATNALIKKLHSQLEQRIEAFDRQIGLIENSPRVDPDYRNAQNDVRSIYPKISNNRLRILVRKEMMRANFPQTRGTVRLSDSSEALYHMLTNMKVGESPPVDAGEYLASEVADTDGDGKLEFIDAWGNPLRFYRWPTRLLKSDGITHDETTDHPNVALLIQGFSDDLVNTDPDDPLGLIIPDNSPVAVKEEFEDAYHTANTYFLPLIVSAGPDGLLGLYEPKKSDSITNYGYLAQPNGNSGELTDNITNRNQRAGD